MGTWDSAESACSTYKNLLRVIEVISLWFSFGLVCCCLFLSNSLQWRMECPVCVAPLNRTLFFFLLFHPFTESEKVSWKTDTPVCPRILLQMCQIRGEISCASWWGCWLAEECANVFQNCEWKKGWGIELQFLYVTEILISLVSCFQMFTFASDYLRLFKSCSGQI